MFLEKSNESDFRTTLETGMRKNASFETDLRQEQINEALSHLAKAAATLSQLGLKKEAEIVMVLKDECEDPHTKNLTNAKMLKNLAEKGIMFDAQDQAFEDDKDLEVEDAPSL